MTENHDHDSRDIDIRDVPLEPWMTALIAEDAEEITVPRELMWARIRKQRAQLQQQQHRRRAITRGIVMLSAVAATLVIGVALGRMSMRETTIVASNTTPTAQDAPDTSVASPVRVAMNEHLTRTATLLASIRAQEPDARPRADVAAWSQELLLTTRLLMDSPEIAGDLHTRRLLEDLEVVLMQIIQSRGTAAPEARRAPSETMRETNLLPRVRAAVTTASAQTNVTLTRGVTE